MKRSIVATGVGVLLLLILTAVVSGERVESDKKPPTTNMPAGTDAHSIPWMSINSGSKDIQSDNYQMLSSVGIPLGGTTAGDNYQTGAGYWYGAPNAEISCNCGFWGDVTGDGNVNPVDVVFMVNKVYLSNDMLVQHLNCPRDAADINCDGNVNPVDVVFFVNRVYLGNDMFCPNPCV